MKNQNQWFFSPDLAFLASLSSVFNSWKKKRCKDKSTIVTVKNSKNHL